jgi:S1-C subfamily serine protease
MNTTTTRTTGFLIALAATSALALFVVPRVADLAQASQTRRQVQLATLQLNKGVDGSNANVLEQLSNATRQIARRVRPSVVHVSAAQTVADGRRQGWEMIGTGSGWIWDDSGHIVTNFHVVENAERIDVQLHDGAVHKATLIEADPLTDIALLRIDAIGLVAATRAPDFAAVEQGDMVFAFGSPLDFRFSMSSGLISGMGRSTGVIGSRNPQGYEDFIQVDAAINPGNSGGPLTDARGRVIGMNTAIATDREHPSAEGRFIGIGLAIGLPMIESVIGQLIDTGVVNKGFLGIGVAEPAMAIAAMGGPRMPIGVVVTDLSIDGLQPGDIIRRCNGARVEAEDDLHKYWLQDDDGTVDLDVVHFSSAVNRTLTLQMPDPWPAARSLLDADTPLHQFISNHGGPPGGMIITSSQPGSPADACGLRAGDLLLRIDGRPIRTLAQLRSTISNNPPGDSIHIEIWRWTEPEHTRSHRATLTVQPGRRP